jgi:hypothetical protein
VLDVEAIPIPTEGWTVLEVAVLILLSATAPGVVPADSTRAAEREARRAAYRYERVVVTSSPQTFGGGYGDRCDEEIGRFCFWFSTPGTPRRPLEPDPPEVVEARDAAIHAFRRWFALSPGEGRAVGPLVRFLIEAERPGEAVAAARTHVWAGGESPATLLVLGLALHHTRDFQAAERAFDQARALMEPARRKGIDDIGVLLARSELARYRRLDGDDLERYQAAFWAFSDPWYLDPGNERRSAHYSRHALAGIHALAPRAEGRIYWGRDHEELLVRYGPPTGRQRVIGPSTMAHRRISLVEYYDPRRVSLSVEDLITGGVRPTPPPGVRPEVERDTVRSHYAPLGIRRTRGLLVQPSVFPGGDGSVIRIDALLRPDTVSPVAPQDPRGLLVVLDTLGHEVARVEVKPQVRPDSTTVLSAEHRLPPGAYVYRAEIRDDATGLGGLAQYRIDVERTDGLTVSDLLVAEPVDGVPPEVRDHPALRPVPPLTVAPGDRVGVYAEVTGLQAGPSGARFGVQWWIERAEPDGLLRRAARWVGQRIGLVEEDIPPRVGWQEGTDADARSLFFTLNLDGAEPGLHRLGLRVMDQVSGTERTVTRLILLDPRASPLDALESN